MNPNNTQMVGILMFCSVGVEFHFGTSSWDANSKSNCNVPCLGGSSNSCPLSHGCFQTNCTTSSPTTSTSSPGQPPMHKPTAKNQVHLLLLSPLQPLVFHHL